MAQEYSKPERADDPHALPDVEVFEGIDYCPACNGESDDEHLEHDRWYWWSCFPGCLPDGEPNGPFDTETEALADAQDVD